MDAVTRSRREAERWEQSENDAVKHHRKALDCVIQAAEKAVEHAKNNNLSRQEVISFGVFYHPFCCLDHVIQSFFMMLHSIIL